MKVEVEVVVLIKGEEKNKGKRSIGIMAEFFKVKDDAVPGVKLQTVKSPAERPIRYLYPLEQHSDMEKSISKSKNTSHNKLKVDVK